MNKKSLVVTTGAMCTAIFGVLMLLNRQTGNLFQEVFLFLYPIPMVAFSAMYGWKAGFPVCGDMALLSFLFGGFSTIFYAVSQALIGLVFGGCLYHKVDRTKILFAVMAMSALVNVLNTIVLGFLFGLDLNQQVLEMQMMMGSVFEQAGVVIPEHIMAENTLRQILIVSMVFSGFLQGFVVYEVSLLILRRLRFPVQKPKSVYSYAPPKWTGYGAFLAFLAYNQSVLKPFANELVQNTALTIGLFGYIYLICFGFIAVMGWLKTNFPKVGKFGLVICFLGLFIFPLGEIMAGFFYIVWRKVVE